MIRYARIQNGAVRDVIESETDPDGINGEWIECGDASVGWTYDSNTKEFTVSTTVDTPRVLTHLEFRRLFTIEERMNIDELEATFEKNTMLLQGQKKALRTGFKDFNASSSVNKDDPDISPMLELFVSLGIIEQKRINEILK